MTRGKLTFEIRHSAFDIPSGNPPPCLHTSSSRGVRLSAPSPANARAITFGLSAAILIARSHARLEIRHPACLPKVSEGRNEANAGDISNNCVGSVDIDVKVDRYNSKSNGSIPLSYISFFLLTVKSAFRLKFHYLVLASLLKHDVRLLTPSQ
jgi:hypothetical protein